MISNKFGTSALRKTVSAGTIKNSGGTGSSNYLDRFKRERPKKIIDHLGSEGKHIKQKFFQTNMYKKQKVSTTNSDRIIIFSVLLLFALAGFLYLSSVKNQQKSYMKSPYFI